MKFFLPILFFLFAFTVTGQRPDTDNSIIIDRTLSKDSTYVLLSGTNPTKFDYGHGKFTLLRTVAAMIDSVNGGGGGDNWGSDVVNTDNTLTGDGTSGNVLKVDTAIIATPHYVDSSLATVGGASSSITITPAQITADQDDYNPTGFGNAEYVILSSNNIWNITSFVDSIGGIHRKTLINGGDSTIVLLPDHPDATASNRLTGFGYGFKLHPGKSVDIFRDNIADRWRISGTEDENGRTGVFFDATDLASATAGDFRDFFPQGLSSGSFGTFTSTTSLPGGLAISSLTTTGGGGHFYFGKSTVTFSAFGSAHIYTECLISIPTLSDGTETFSSELQLINVPNTGGLEGNNGIFIRYSHGINSGKWELVSQDNTGTESTPADLGVTVAAATLYKLRIEIDKSKTEARAYINDIYVGSVTTNLPNSLVCGARIVHLKSAGTTARTLNVHSFSAGAIYK